MSDQKVIFQVKELKQIYANLDLRTLANINSELKISDNDLTRNHFGLPFYLSIFAYIKVGNGINYCMTPPMLENQYIRSCNMKQSRNHCISVLFCGRCLIFIPDSLQILIRFSRFLDCLIFSPDTVRNRCNSVAKTDSDIDADIF